MLLLAKLERVVLVQPNGNLKINKGQTFFNLIARINDILVLTNYTKGVVDWRKLKHNFYVLIVGTFLPNSWGDVPIVENGTR